MRRTFVFGALSSLLGACSQAPDAGFSEIVSHNIKIEHRLFEMSHMRSAQSCRVDRSGSTPDFEALSVTVRVDRTGHVSVRDVAHAYDDHAVTPACDRRARAIANAWRYEPFVGHDGPAVVEFEEMLPVSPPERWREPRIAFPEDYDVSTASVVLERTACLGSCPVYRVELRGDGTFRYEGAGFVRVEGVREGVIDRTQFADLIERFGAADFYSLYETYEAPITDNPASILTLELNGRRHTVVDYLGERVGMPSAVVDLERRVDEIAQTEQFVGD